MTESISVRGVLSAELSAMIAARDTRAAQKYKLLQLRALMPDTAIFVIEGDDDKIVYGNWCKKIDPSFEFEPFPCKGKRSVLRLRDAVLADKHNLSRMVFFFIDNDFDGWGDHGPHESTFKLAAHSVENYLVSHGVLRSILTNCFHCEGHPAVRESIVVRFRECFRKFLDASRPINQALFFAAKLRIEIIIKPSSIDKFVGVTLENVVLKFDDVNEVVSLAREPTAEELAQLSVEFDGLDPEFAYRGKYAWEFFRRWIFLLGKEYGSRTNGWFEDLEVGRKLREHEISLGSAAIGSDLPIGLKEFVLAAAAPITPSTPAPHPARNTSAPHPPRRV